jgi:Rrf2 family protein
MQLTRGADYAVRALIHLAGLPISTRIMLPEIARITEAPDDFLYKILQALRRAGFVRSWRGKRGGFEILPAGRSATVKAAIEAIDGPIRLNVCVYPEELCTRRRGCPVHSLWARARVPS